eukprot:scaffold36298_cov122-Isochrysis_galbana.AAC.24
MRRPADDACSALNSVEPRRLQATTEPGERARRADANARPRPRLAPMTTETASGALQKVGVRMGVVRRSEISTT